MAGDSALTRLVGNRHANGRDRENAALTALFTTIATIDFLPRVHALRASLEEVYGTEVAFAALCIDEPGSRHRYGGNRFDTILLSDLRIPAIWDMAFRYEKGAFANALKPFFIQHVMAEQQPSSLVFLDADTLVYGCFDEVHALLEGGDASIVLTPHVERPQRRTREPFEIDLLRHGVLNGGFVALKPDGSARAFLDWWADHLKTDCRYEPEQGYYGDQHWLDLAPALFDGVHVLRHRGYNAAYWNYPDRVPAYHEGRWWIGSDRLKFFHFSQWRLERGETVEGCLHRLFLTDDPSLEALLGDYRERWLEGRDRLSEDGPAEYPFGAFSDGSAIPKIVRDTYARLNPSRALPRECLFDQGAALVMRRSTEMPFFEGIEMTDLYVHIWQTRPALHQHFDVWTRAGQLHFLRWLIEHASSDHAVSDAMLDPARQSLARDATREDPAHAALQRLADAHARFGDGRASIGELSSEAAVLLQCLAEAIDADDARRTELDGSVDFFQALDLLKQAAGDRLDAANVKRSLDEIENHRRYFIEKSRSDAQCSAFGPFGVEHALIEADAVLNGCRVLAGLLERLSRA